MGVGVIGAGTISTQYLGNLTRFPDLDVRWVADLDPARADAQARAFDVPRSGSAADLLADDAVEVVVNLTVPAAHVEVGLEALAAGKHVWSEKPVALDREGARTLLDAATAAGRRLAVAPDTVLGAGLQTARRLLETGAVGEPLTALTLLQGPGPESWHPDPAFLYQPGAGPLFDLGPYYLTALVHLLGPVTRVSAATSRSRAERTVGSGPRAGQRFPVAVPTHVGALYTFAGGRSAQSVFSTDSALVRRQFEVTGVDGVLVVPDPNRFDGDVEVHPRGGAATTVPAAGATTTRGTGVLELARALRAGRPERAPGALAAHVLDAMAATLEAGERGTPVDVGSSLEVPPALPEDWDPHASTLRG